MMTAQPSASDAKLIRAKRRLIAIAYRRPRKPTSMAALRCAELNRLWTDRYGPVLPDDDAGKDDALIMLHHLALLSGNQRARMKSWLTVRAPWITDETIEAVIAKPLRWRADKLAARLNLKEADRARLRITTIGAVDMTKAEREAARKDRMRQAKLKARRKQPRAEYIAASKACKKPWDVEGKSRRTWYRHRREANKQQLNGVAQV